MLNKVWWSLCCGSNFPCFEEQISQLPLVAISESSQWCAELSEKLQNGIFYISNFWYIQLFRASPWSSTYLGSTVSWHIFLNSLENVSNAQICLPQFQRCTSHCPLLGRHAAISSSLLIVSCFLHTVFRNDHVAKQTSLLQQALIQCVQVKVSNN